MKLNIKRQETYSRGELLLRSFFGIFYIMIPHIFAMLFVGIYAGILGIIAFWVILFTGRYPENWFNVQVQMMRWGLRVNARIWNLADGYPAFGLSGTDEHTELEVEYPETLSRGLLLLKAFFGVFYVILPHYFVLYFRIIWGQILMFIAWWVVLFTGKYPENWFNFQVGTLRWMQRVSLYMSNMSDQYPPFSGREDA